MAPSAMPGLHVQRCRAARTTSGAVSGMTDAREGRCALRHLQHADRCALYGSRRHRALDPRAAGRAGCRCAPSPRARALQHQPARGSSQRAQLVQRGPASPPPGLSRLSLATSCAPRGRRGPHRRAQKHARVEGRSPRRRTAWTPSALLPQKPLLHHSAVRVPSVAEEGRRPEQREARKKQAPSRGGRRVVGRRGQALLPSRPSSRERYGSAIP